jgi:hypothetical protein
MGDDPTNRGPPGGTGSATAPGIPVAGASSASSATISGSGAGSSTIGAEAEGCGLAGGRDQNSEVGAPDPARSSVAR